MPNVYDGSVTFNTNPTDFIVLSYSAIYSFGDSLSDAGDAYLLTASPIAADLGISAEPVSPPYYQETYGTTVADVFSNGPVWVQDLAVSLGLAAPAPGAVGATANEITSALEAQGGLIALEAPATVAALEAADGASGSNPYLQLIPGAAGGTDFAIGSAVTGVTNFNSGAQVALTDLSAQIANFQAEVPDPSPAALYTVWSGANDLLNLLSAPDFAALYASGAAAVDVTQSVDNEVAAVEQLVTDGARSVLVVDVPDLGAVPAVTAAGATAEAAATALAASFDSQLAADLSATEFGTADVMLEDTYTTINAAIAQPGSYGLSNVTDPVYTGSATQDDGTIVSSDPTEQDTYLFFDSLHPTETGQALVAAEAESVLSAACYLAGTPIATTAGEIAVEALAIGMQVLTAGGAARPIKWIGQRSYRRALLRGADGMTPIRIEAGALAEGVPTQPLHVSPLHALFVDGALVPARHLVNGVSIRPCPEIDPICYFHIELDSHDIILAAGAPAESFVDCDSRGMFHNAAQFAALYPADTAPAWRFCAPRVEAGPQLEAVRDRLRRRAGVTIRKGQGDALRGWIDQAADGVVAGWAWQPDFPDDPVVLEVLLDGVVVDSVLANALRPDVRDAGEGDGRSGFTCPLPEPACAGAVLQVRRAVDRAELWNSGMVFGAAVRVAA